MLATPGEPRRRPRALTRRWKCRHGFGSTSFLFPFRKARTSAARSGGRTGANRRTLAYGSTYALLVRSSWMRVILTNSGRASFYFSVLPFFARGHSRRRRGRGESRSMNDFDTFDTDRDGSLSFAVRPPPTRARPRDPPVVRGRFTASDERTKLGAMREPGGATSARVRPRHRASLTRPSRPVVPPSLPRAGGPRGPAPARHRGFQRAALRGVQGAGR